MRRILNLITLSMLAVVFIASGCSKNSGSTVPEDTGLNLEDEFGGYTASDEAPGFGDEDIQALMDIDAEVSEDDPEFAAEFATLDTLPIVKVYAMKILWGMLEFDSTVSRATDWSGSLSIDRGAIKVASLIRFEKPFDHVLRPRTSRRTIDWVSYTKPHFDGILVWLYDLSDSLGLDENTVTFETGPYSRTFAISDLDSLSEIVEVDDLGNKVSFEARYIPDPECGNGFLDGRWVTGDDGRGVFFGRWVNWNGLGMGHLRGHFGVNGSGDRVFFGKWVGNFGEFRGLLRGEWGLESEMCADCPASGWFDGIFADRKGNQLGEIGGRWCSPPDRPRGDGDTGNNDDGGNGYGPYADDALGRIPKDPRGFFAGRWHKLCPDAD